MTWVAVAVAGAAVVGGVASNSASKRAADAQTNASNAAIEAQRGQADTVRGDQALYTGAGNSAILALTGKLGLSTNRGPSVATSDYITRDQFDADAYSAANPTLRQQTNYYGSHPYEHYIDYGRDHGLQGYKYGDTPQNAGANGAGALESSPLLRKFTAGDLNADPVYQSGLQFGLDRGTEGINARASRSGMFDSGATLKALTQFGNDYGSTKAGESYNRFTNDQNSVFNKLSGIAGTGQVANSQVATAGNNAANNIGQDITGAGNARAAGIVGGANAWGGAMTGVSGAASNYQSNQTLQALLRNNGQYGRSPYYTSYDSQP